MFTRKKIAMILAEFLGTWLLTTVALSITQSNVGIAYFISMGAGLALMAAVLTFGAVSGAHINPAITLGLWSLRRIKTLPAIAYVAAQLLGGIAAYHLFTYFVGATWENTGAFDAKILVAEAVGALVFAMGWAAVMYQKYTGFHAAAALGASLVLGLIVASTASVATGAFASGFINPAVALGAQSWVWGTYALGPVLGAVIGFNLYALLFAPASELVKAEKAATTKKKK